MHADRWADQHARMQQPPHDTALAMLACAPDMHVHACAHPSRTSRQSGGMGLTMDGPPATNDLLPPAASSWGAPAARDMGRKMEAMRLE